MRNLLFAVLALGVLAGCGSSSAPTGTAPETNQSGWANVGLDTDVKTVEINGVTCVIANGLHRDVAISCAWPPSATTTTTVFP